VEKAVSEGSVELHREEHCLEIKPLGLMGIKKMMTSQHPCITDLQFGPDTISITIEKFFFQHTIEIAYAAIQVEDGIIHVGVQLQEGFPFLLRGIGGEVVTTLINLLLGVGQEESSSIDIQDDVVVYHLPMEKLGLIPQLVLHHGIQNVSLRLSPKQNSVWIEYPEDLRINPSIANVLGATLQEYKRLGE